MAQPLKTGDLLQRFDYQDKHLRSTGSKLCVDSLEEAVRGVTLQDCDTNLPSQKWLILNSPRMDSARTGEY